MTSRTCICATPKPCREKCAMHPNGECYDCLLPLPKEVKCCEFCSKETLHDDTNAPNCTDPSCKCHRATTSAEKVEQVKMLECATCKKPNKSITLEQAKAMNAVGGRCPECVKKDSVISAPTALEADSEWEKEFDGEFPQVNLGSHKGWFGVPEVKAIKSFIRSLIHERESKAREEGKIDYIKKTLLDFHANQMEGKGFDFFFVLSTDLKKGLDDSEAYEYRGVISCEEHFDEAVGKRDTERQEVMEELNASVKSQRNGEFINNPKARIATDGLPIMEIKEPLRVQEYEGRSN